MNIPKSRENLKGIQKKGSYIGGKGKIVLGNAYQSHGTCKRFCSTAHSEHIIFYNKNKHHFQTKDINS
jgi:hypothetical protein